MSNLGATGGGNSRFPGTQIVLKGPRAPGGRIPLLSRIPHPMRKGAGREGPKNGSLKSEAWI